MGNIMTRRQNARIEEVDSVAGNQAYLYPPKSGTYFSSHFIMGGERFETCQPEVYLFGENLDLNFLGGKATPFPYSAPLPHEPTRTLRALINIRKESLRFIRINIQPVNGSSELPVEPMVLPLEERESSTTSRSSSVNLSLKPIPVESQSQAQLPPEPLPASLQKAFQYNIEFTFDTDVKCAISVHYFCSEEITGNGAIYSPRDPSIGSESYLYKRGANQQFNQPLHVFEPSLYDEDDLMYRAFDEQGNFDSTVPFPVVIQCVAQEGDEPRQSHALIAVVERNHDNSFSIKPFKQKIFIDGLYYLLQEIYGIENKNVTNIKPGEQYICPEEEIEDNGSECVICMSDSRDTLILPCRHLCLCNACADSLRYQANNCPICRSPFRALLQIKAVRKSVAPIPSVPINATPPTLPHHHQLMSGSASDLVDIPPGYEPLSLIEALNGPSAAPLPASHGMFTFRSESDHTPLGTRRGYSRNKRDAASLSNHNAIGDTGIGAIVRRTGSPTNPEVLVSSRPLSPDKGEIILMKESSSQVESKWRVPVRPRHLIGADTGHESSTSSSSSSATGIIAIQERIRLLSSHDKDDEVEDELPSRKTSVEEATELTAFKMKPRTATSPVKESGGDSSPISVGVSSGSYAIISLRDGLDEQKCMTDTDLLSITTGSTSNIALVGGKCEEETESDYTPDDLPGAPFTHNLPPKESKHEDKKTITLKLKQLNTIVKLADAETTEDLDLSPIED